MIPTKARHFPFAFSWRLRAAVPFASSGKTGKQKFFSKKDADRTSSKVKHIKLAQDGEMGGNGIWHFPFAFSWRLRAAVPFALKYGRGWEG